MKAIYSYKDPDLGVCHIVIPKIRHVGKAMGNLIVSFDNGEKISIYADDANAATQSLLDAIEAFYQN